jgi:hypothetical protein
VVAPIGAGLVAEPAGVCPGEYAFAFAAARIASRAARSSQLSHRACIGRTRPPPTPTMRMPAMVARKAMRIGVVTVVAMPIWLRALAI